MSGPHLVWFLSLAFKGSVRAATHSATQSHQFLDLSIRLTPADTQNILPPVTFIQVTFPALL